MGLRATVQVIQLRFVSLDFILGSGVRRWSMVYTARMPLIDTTRQLMSSGHVIVTEDLGQRTS